MAFPDRIKRTVEVAHPPHTVWTALTRPTGWVPGSVTRPRSTCARAGQPGCGAGEGARGADAAERVEEPVVFGFTWPIYGLPEEESLGLVALDVMSITWMAVIAVLVLAQKLLSAKTTIDLVPGLSPPM